MASTPDPLTAPAGYIHDLNFGFKASDPPFTASFKDYDDDSKELMFTLRTGRSIADIQEIEGDVWPPSRKPNRHAFSFSNGTWLADKNQFIAHTTLIRFMKAIQRRLDQYLPNDVVRMILRLSDVPFKSSDVSDSTFDEKWLSVDPMEIPTPNIDSVLNAQGYIGFDLELCYALLGRLQYECGCGHRDPALPDDCIDTWLVGRSDDKKLFKTMVEFWYDDYLITDNMWDSDGEFLLKVGALKVGTDMQTWYDHVCGTPHLYVSTDIKRDILMQDVASEVIIAIDFPSDAKVHLDPYNNHYDFDYYDDLAWRTKCRRAYLKYVKVTQTPGNGIKNFHDYMKGSVFELKSKAVACNL